MHIKQITISNFRSFRQQPEIQPFSPTTNVVVGRNGSGKSNLFDAIQFVLLTQRFHTLRTEERQALLHEGSGSAAMNAFVEVVFDNSDNRFSLENSDEVVLRRTVGAKKDEFFLQRKLAKKSEVTSFLEGAGFSNKSNPYFMVQQGKIQTLCLMTDAQRLSLLQQVAGTTLYEEKKNESMAKMQENAQSIEKIDTILQDINQRLEELHGEKEELNQYQKADRQRKALEYTLYDKELRRARRSLDAVEHDRNNQVEAMTHLHEQSKATHDAIRNAEGELHVKSQALKRNRKILTQLESDKTMTLTLKTKLDLQCQELQEQIESGQEAMQRAQKELKTLERQITEARQKLEEKEQLLTNENNSLRKLRHEADQAQRQLDGLYSKQGRGSKYATKEQRDKAIQKQIRALQKSIQDKNQQLQGQVDALSNARRTIESNEKELETKQAELDSSQKSVQSLSKALDEKKKNQLALLETRKQSWRSAEDKQDQMRDARETLGRAEAGFRKSMPRNTGMGIRALERLVVEENLVVGQQYFGMLVENMKLKDPKFQTAVEMAAQNALFHVVVDTDATAARLMQRLENDKLGRVTFLPLNQLHVSDQTMYPPNTTDVVPLLDECISYNPQVRKAMLHVFDRKILARTSEIASEWSTRLNMDAITLDGDLCSRKGALTGGYVDSTKSRLRAYDQKKTAQDAFNKLKTEHEKVDRQAKEAEQEVANVGQEVSRLNHKQTQLSRKIKALEQSVEQIAAQIQSSTTQATKLETSQIPPLQDEITSLEHEVGRLQTELGTELSSTLSDEDRAKLDQLKQDIVRFNERVQVQKEAVDDISMQREELQSLLNDNLLRRKTELLSAGLGQDDDADDEDAGTSRRATTAQWLEMKAQEKSSLVEQLKEAQRSLDEMEADLREARGVEEKTKSEMDTVKTELDRLKGEDMKTSKRLEEAQQAGEKLMIKKSNNISKRETYMRKIQELGTLPPISELEHYKNDTIQHLMKSLEKVNKKLKKYSHVNKKAFDQFVNFSEQQESLLKRKEELDRGADKIKELIESLDLKKDEAINRTFKGVSKHFRDVFKELVPLGEGELIMRTVMDDAVDGEEEEGTDQEVDSEGEGSPTSKASRKKPFDPDNPDVSRYRGVGIKVRFSAVGENFIMSQLSGGQKALVALALIFAIQRCDPAPFYIFDELDQALDSTYRQSVANLIQRQANSAENPTQFICSTFRPELVAVSKNCYGISHQNKVSNIYPMSKSDALKFIGNLMKEEEAVGEVTTLASSRRSSRSDSARKRKAIEAAPAADDDEEEEDEETPAESLGLATQPE